MKNTLLLPFGVLFLAVSLLFTGVSRFFTVPVHSSVIAAGEAFPLLILDAGHGGEDGGAVGVSGVLEKDLNLSYTRTLAVLLSMAGFSVLESRTEDRLLYDETTAAGHKKRDDLKNRLLLTQRYPDSIFISIHMNAFPGADCQGTQVWYSANNAASAEWANAIQERVLVLQPQNHRLAKAANSSIYILKNATVPAILIECGFVSSPEECEKLTSDAYRLSLCGAFFSVIGEKIQSGT